MNESGYIGCCVRGALLDAGQIGEETERFIVCGTYGCTVESVVRSQESKLY